MNEKINNLEKFIKHSNEEIKKKKKKKIKKYKIYYRFKKT